VSAGAKHHVTALAIDPASGTLSPHGAPITLPTRPIHMTTDIPSQHILVAFSNPSGLRVYRINADGTPGPEVMQREGVDPGIYGHQVRVRLDNQKVILVTRGHDAAGGKPEEPGALKVFDYSNGQLTSEESVAPNGGYGFGPRHLDFHPTEPWVYVSLERQNRLDMFAFHDRTLLAAAVFQKGTLAEPGSIRGHQVAGTVHVHPNGRFLYGANRAEATVEYQGKKVFKGGENSIVVYAIDQETGEPKPIQHIETQKIHPRTFHIHPGGKLMVAQHNLPVNVRDGDAVKTVAAGLSVFRIGDDGKLTFARTYDIDVGDKLMFWMGMVPLAA
jgi:6-phosphogluconolactonase (cycloisomerase 2 family)